MESRKRAPGALRLRGSSGGHRGAPGPTNRRALPHQEGIDLFADDPRSLNEPPQSPTFHLRAGRPRAGVKLIGNASMDVGDWLRSLGLSQYEVAFRENGIDGDVLVDLSDADLEKLGVLPLGHRKRLLRAIAGLRAPDAGSSPSSAVNSRPAADAAERRQLTVMFCDLVGSTGLAARLDPEDMRSVIAAYHQCCATL